MAAVAVAGTDQSVQQETSVVLDGSASTGNDYEWSLLDDGGTGFDDTYLAGSMTDTASFTAPNTAGSLTFQLLVREHHYEGANQILNGTFDSDISFWGSTFATWDSFAGGTMRIDPDGATGNAQVWTVFADAPDVVPGVEYALTGSSYVVGGSSHIYGYISWRNASNVELSSVNTGALPFLADAWQDFELVATAPAGAVKGRVFLRRANTPAVGETSHWDNIEFKETKQPTTSDTDTVSITVEYATAFVVPPLAPFVTIEKVAPTRDNIEVFATDKGGQALLAQFTVIDSLQFEDRLNAPGALEMTLPNERLPNGDSLGTVLEPNVHEVLVTQFGKPIWAGPVLTVNEEPLGSPGSVTIGCEGLLGYARFFYVWSHLEGATSGYTANDEGDDSFPPGRLVDVEQTEILRRLLDFQLNKAWGFMYNLENYTNVQATGVLRTRVYSPTEMPNVYEMMTNLTNVIDGFDYAITPDRELRTWYPKRGRKRLDKAFHNGNIITLSREIDGTRQASRVLAIGAGEGPDQLRLKEVDWPARERYGPSNVVYSNTDVSNRDTLVQQTRDELEQVKSNPQAFNITVRSESAVGLELGDSVRIAYESGYSNVDEWRRVTGLLYRPFENTTEMVVS